MRQHRVSGGHVVGLFIGSLVLSGVATAGPRAGGGGSGGGGGRLGEVSGGLGGAGGNRGGGGGSSSGGGGRVVVVDTDLEPRVPEVECDAPPRPQVVTPDGLYTRIETENQTIIVDSEGRVVRSFLHPKRQHGTANIDGFVGVQLVHESDKALALGLSLDDRWLRLAGSITRYQEPQMGRDPLTLTLPTFTLGIRIDDRGATKVFLEGGVAMVKTKNDPMEDTSMTGAIAGVHVEHRLGAATLIGDAHMMGFELGVRARRARAGVRVGHLEAALTVLDFNVGPALYGPEIGLAF